MPPSESLLLAHSQADVVGTLIHLARGESPELPAIWFTLSGDAMSTQGVDLWPLLMLGASAAARGDLDAAVEHGLRAVHAAREISGFYDDFPITWTITTEWAIADEQFDVACNLVQMVANASPRERLPLLKGNFLRLRCTFAMADPTTLCAPADIEGDLRAAISSLDAAGAKPHRAQAQARLGGWLHDRGEEEEGHELLAAAAGTYRVTSGPNAGWPSFRKHSANLSGS